MSDSDKPSQSQPSSELGKWLLSLALPLWARGLLVIVWIAVMVGGLILAAWALVHQDRESMTAAIGLLTVTLPVSLLVIGLLFGQRGEKRLSALTENVLDILIPTHIERIVCVPRCLTLQKLSRAGCKATYLLSSGKQRQTHSLRLKFSVELNVRKVNLMFILPENLGLTDRLDDFQVLEPYLHVIAGARAEGYQLNEQIAKYAGDDGGVGMLFFRTLPDDFLLSPIERLYFAQDLAFFVRGVVEAQATVSAPLVQKSV